MSKTIYKPWLNETDADEVFFSSIQLFAGKVKFFQSIKLNTLNARYFH
jgi:hypothetical protein